MAWLAPEVRVIPEGRERKGAVLKEKNKANRARTMGGKGKKGEE